MAATFAAMDPLFKDDFGPVLNTQLNNSCPALEWFEKVENVQWIGKSHVEPIHVNRNRGSYWTAESGAAPDAGQQQLEWLRIPCRYFHGACQFTVQAIKASQSQKGAFAKLMRLEMDNILDDMRVNRNFAIWGDGRGVRALVDTGSSGTVLELDAPGGIANDSDGNRYLNVGDYIAYVIPATGALRDAISRKITAINTDGSDVTLDQAHGATADDYVVKAFGADSSLVIGDTDYNHAAMGIRGIVDSGAVVNNFFGLSRVTFPILQAYVLSSAGALSADLLYRAIDVVGSQGQSNVQFHGMSYDTRRALLSIMENDRRYSHEYLMKPDAGTKVAGDYKASLTFGGTPIKCDHFAPYGEWYGIDNRSWRRASMTDGEWADETGAVLTEVAGSVDTYKATYRIYENYFAIRPNQSFRLSGLTTNVIVAHVV